MSLLEKMRQKREREGLPMTVNNPPTARGSEPTREPPTTQEDRNARHRPAVGEKTPSYSALTSRDAKNARQRPDFVENEAPYNSVPNTQRQPSFQKPTTPQEKNDIILDNDVRYESPRRQPSVNTDVKRAQARTPETPRAESRISRESSVSLRSLARASSVTSTEDAPDASQGNSEAESSASSVG